MRVTVACVVILLITCSIAFASAEIFFDDDTYDFGDVNQGDVLEHTFTFKNIGDQTLVIEKVTAS
ncbi:MAG: DUF1573 domain-containing protein [Nitrospirae bacterium]|nr:DUF1573 domain-containing protein [Nitrospirota bacterium]